MLFSIKSENLKLASRSRDYMRKSTIENLKACQPREQNMQLSFDKRCSFPAQNSAFSLGQTRLMPGKLSRSESKHTRKNRHASGLNENGSSFLWSISAKELLMVSRKEDSTSFFAALLMSGTCNYSFLLSAVNSLIYYRSIVIV